MVHLQLEFTFYLFEEQGHILIINYSCARRSPSKDYVDDVSRGESLMCVTVAGATPFSYLEEVVKKVTQLGSSKAH